jgi:NADH dehydrogenase [ubiquinone] 1 alpha subcomplex assembly factor 6
MADVSTASAEAVRRHDRERYLTALFAPADRRADLLALYAFNLEIARTRESVRESMLGQIRLQWWRDALDEIQAAKPPRRHQVVEPLADAIRRHNLPRDAFERLLLARERDLDDTPFQTLGELEAYADGTSGALIALALMILGTPDAEMLARSRQVGRGYALVGLLRAIPFHARQHRCLLPDDVLARHGMDRDAVLAMTRSSGLAAAVAEIASVAEAGLKPVRATAAAWPALAPAVLARRHLKTLRRVKYDVFAPSLAAEPGAGAVLALIGASLVKRA